MDKNLGINIRISSCFNAVKAVYIDWNNEYLLMTNGKYP